MSAPAPPAAPEAMAAPPYPAAITISGPAWHSPLAHDGKTVPLIHPRTSVGQLESNDVVLTDPAASRVHASIEWAPQGYLLRDLGSTSGTLLAGRPITGPTWLAPGQQIQIGSTRIDFQAVQAEGATPVMAPPPASQPAVPPVTSLPMQAITNAARAGQAPGQKHWLARQRSKLYWRIFLVGLLIYAVSWVLLAATDDLNLIPLVSLSAASVVPVTFVVFCWEQGAFADMPPVVLGLAFVSGGTLGVVMAVTLEAIFVGGRNVGSMLIVAICEETAKTLAVVWFLSRKNLRSELDGLVLGAATGMGFAALETAGYGVSVFLKELVHALAGGAADADAVNAATGAMGGVLTARLVLALFGHGIWTAIICAAIWRERRNRTLRVTSGVLLAFCIAVLLHWIWDSVPVIGWIFDAVAGVLLLRFFLRESLERARLAPDTPAPPLGPALLHYFAGLFHHHRRAVAQPEAFVGAGIPPGGVSPWPGAPTTAMAAAGPVHAASGPAAVPPVSAAPAGSPAYCPNCGHAIIPGTRFCGRCGHALGI